MRLRRHRLEEDRSQYIAYLPKSRIFISTKEHDICVYQILNGILLLQKL